MPSLISVNIGTPRAITTKSGQTGIFKSPQSGPVNIGPLGLDDDHIIDTDNHGGIDQAVYLYFQQDYDWWMEQLGLALDPGTFGENLTISGGTSADILVGDRFAIGHVTLEATSPRIPCVTLASRMADPAFAKKFLVAKRPGVYCRTITPGTVEAGMPITHHPFTGEKLPINDLLDYRNHPPASEMQRRLQTPLHYKTRADYLEALGLRA